MHAVNGIRKKLVNKFVGSGTTLINNEIKDILTLSTSWEIKKISLKGKTRKVSG